MDKLFTTGQAAESLGTTVPRVLRAVREGLAGVERRGNRNLLTEQAVETLRARWGTTPRHPQLSPAALRVLAVLSRRPLGLRSARGVARAAGVSPSTASAHLAEFVERGLVARRRVRVRRGEVRDIDVWQMVSDAPEWEELMAVLNDVELPPQPRPTRPRTVPKRLSHLFWNEDVRELDTERDAVLIADRILSGNDPEAFAWLLDAVPGSALLSAGRKRGIDPAQARLAETLAPAALP